jgi:deoxyribonuclease-4
MSIAEGLDQAPVFGKRVGCDCIQIFTKSNRQWQARPIGDDEAAAFKASCREQDVHPVCAHNCYLINLAASDSALRKKSEKSFAMELDRCERLGLPYLIAHPGAHTGGGEEKGIALIAAALHRLLESTKSYNVGMLLETTAGQGSSIGHTFEQVAQIIGQVCETCSDGERRIGVCYDTCHTFTAGYDIRTPHAYKETFDKFDHVIGLKKLKAFHFNDAKAEFGSRVDRHEHIGKGNLGPEPFKMLMKDPRFRDIPKFLETPKGMTGKRDWDAVSLELLRRLAAG